MAINTYNTVESGNIGLGQGGSQVVTGTLTPENANIVAIFCLEDSDVKTTGARQADLDGITLSEGWTILGNWSTIIVNSGSVIAYLG